MSIILGALGGIGEAAGQIGSKMMQADIDSDARAQQSSLELQRQQALMAFKNTLDVNTANQQREAQVGRVNTAAGGIVSNALNSKYAGSDAAVTAANSGQTDAPLTDDQQAAIAQSKSLDQQSMMNDPKVRMQAAIQTGDIGPEKAASMGQSAEINQMKMDSLMARADDKNQTAKEIADVKAESMKYGYELRLQAAQEKRLNGKIDTATGRMLITSEDANIKASTSQLNMLNRQLDNVRATKDGKPNPEYQSIQSQMEDLRSGIKDSQETKAGYLKSMGLMPDASIHDKASSMPKTYSASIDSLPAGAVQIGTSDGKPVYQTPDGKKFVSQ